MTRESWSQPPYRFPWRVFLLQRGQSTKMQADTLLSPALPPTRISPAGDGTLISAHRRYTRVPSSAIISLRFTSTSGGKIMCSGPSPLEMEEAGYTCSNGATLISESKLAMRSPAVSRLGCISLQLSIEHFSKSQYDFLIKCVSNKEMYLWNNFWNIWVS